MTNHLRLECGSTSIPLNSGNVRYRTYTPVYDPKSETVSESVQLVMDGPAIMANAERIQRILEDARQRQADRVGERVYLVYKIGSGGEYRSEILGGDLAVSQGRMGMDNIRWNFVNASLNITRRNWWDGDEVELSITTMHGSGTGGQDIDNFDDGLTGSNAIVIESADVDGDLPCPVRLKLKNTAAGGSNVDRFYIGHNVADPDNFWGTIEGESATGGSDVAEATCSGGEYKTTSWTSTSEGKRFEWSVPTATLDTCKGGLFVVMVRFFDQVYSDLYMRFKLQAVVGAVYYEVWNGNLALMGEDSQLEYVDTVRLPPYLPGQTGITDLALELWARRNQSGTHTINLDYLHLLPISPQSGFNAFKSVTRGVDENEYFTHDSFEMIAYRTETGGDKSGEFSHYGKGVFLAPGKKQRLYVLTRDYNGFAYISQTWKVQVYYRPRRRSVG